MALIHPVEHCADMADMADVRRHLDAFIEFERGQFQRLRAQATQES